MSKNKWGRGRTTYDILMGIHEDVEAVRAGGAQDFNGVLDPELIIGARALGLDGLPCENVADAVVAEALET